MLENLISFSVNYRRVEAYEPITIRPCHEITLWNLIKRDRGNEGHNVDVLMGIGQNLILPEDNMCISVITKVLMFGFRKC